MSESTASTQKRDSVFGRGAPLFYDDPVHIVRGQGVHLFDADGRRYLDLYNNVPSVGHANPHVVEALNRQAATLNVHSRYLNDEILRYGERLLGRHHAGIECVVFTCTGTEANEVAMMMARVATGGRGFVCTNAAYHGNSREVGQLTRVQDGAAGDIRAVPYPSLENTADQTAAAITNHCLDQLDAVIAGFEADGVPFAGMLVCPILANEGLPDIPPGYMQRAAERVRAAGGVFIADEVQAGLVRTGRWWGYEVANVAPDIVTMGKPLGNGYPIAAAAASREIVEGFRQAYRYFNTFAASPVQGAVGNAVLDVIERDELQLRVAEVGGWLKQQVGTLTLDHDRVRSVRGTGLFIGVEMVDARGEADLDGARRIANQLREAGYLLGNAGARGNIIKIRPPLVFEREHAEEFVDAFGAVLSRHG